MRWIVPWLVVTMVLAGCAESTPEDEAEAPADAPQELATGFLRGIVIDEAIRPIETAEIVVSFNGTEVAILTTDAEGNWGVGDLEPGTYLVTASKAGFQTGNTTADVVAGEQTPEPVEIRLAQIVAQENVILPLHIEGVVGCAGGLEGVVIGNYCGIINTYSGANLVTDHSLVFFYDEVMAVGELVTYVVTEVVWEAGNPLAEDMILRVAAGNWEYWSEFSFAGAVGGGGGSGYIYALATDEIREGEEDGRLSRYQVGIDTGLSIELFPSGGLGTDVGVMVNQPFELFMHVFYGCQPVEGWSFVAGDVPACAPDP